MKAKDCAEKDLPVRKIMDKLLNSVAVDMDVIIADIPKKEQQEGLKRLFHRKTIAELLELYPNWCINEMDKPDEVCATCLEVHAAFTIPSCNTVFYFR